MLELGYEKERNTFYEAQLPMMSSWLMKGNYLFEYPFFFSYLQHLKGHSLTIWLKFEDIWFLCFIPEILFLRNQLVLQNDKEQVEHSRRNANIK